ncbi:uncharacterized protein [Pocillopora verrucosa]|uniref:uncharacterized protein isoform X2 n=1 Tax=Pocillopora verrucosa TaxID=203993 RepID=UPI002797812E|nr:uncharacterized protein LOC131769637 isoform X2 [Pocillopora verrucosa]
MLFKMNGYLLCILPLFALPNVLAITCYTCTPNPPTVSCTTLADLNVTDCDADPTVPSGMADVCSKRLAVAKMGQMNQTMNMFSCGTKSMCQDFQAKSCNASLLPPGMTFKKCEATCCEQNKCNGLAESTSPSVNAAPSVNAWPSVNASPSVNTSLSVNASPSVDASPSVNASPSANASPSVNTSPSVNASPSGPVTSVPVKTMATGTPPKPSSGATTYNKVVSFATTLTSVLYVLFCMY